MTYQETFEAAKKQSRDILRVQMAGRVQGRVSNAKAALIATIKVLAMQLAAWKETDARREKSEKEHAEIIKKTRAEIEAMPEADRELALESFDKELAESEKADERSAESRAKERETEKKRLEDDVAAARKEYERLLGVQQEVEDGTQKVNKEEMLALANKLVEEGRVNEDVE